jgi:hypothetical protein
MGVSSGLHRTVAALAAPIAIAALLMLGAANAGAAPVRLGPNLATATPSGTVECENKNGCTVAQKSSGYTSPVTGTIVRWSVKGAAGALTLRVLDGNTGAAGLASGFASGSGVSTFSANEPIVAGEHIGLDVPKVTGTGVGYEKTAATFSYWAPELAVGETRAPKKETSEAKLLYSAEVLPVPGITSVSPNAGPVEQIDTVTITGHDFEEVSGVQVGDLFAGFEVLSDTEIVAEVVGFDLGPAPVSVTTPAGTATVPAGFTFEPAPLPPAPPVIPPIPPLELPGDGGQSGAGDVICRVPKLKGATLTVAKRKLAAAHCKLGAVTRAKGLAAGHGKVVHQVPGAGAAASAGWHVKVRLG